MPERTNVRGKDVPVMFELEQNETELLLTVLLKERKELVIFGLG